MKRRLCSNCKKDLVYDDENDEFYCNSCGKVHEKNSFVKYIKNDFINTCRVLEVLFFILELIFGITFVWYILLVLPTLSVVLNIIYILIYIFALLMVYFIKKFFMLSSDIVLKKK